MFEDTAFRPFCSPAYPDRHESRFALKYGRWYLPSTLSTLILVLGLGGAMPATAGCSPAKDGCAPIFDRCCGSMACELTAWPPECRHKPPREGEVCTILSGCDGADLYCKGFQDGLAGRCTRYSKLGEECDGVVTLCGDKLSCTQDARYPQVQKFPGKGRCYPQGRNMLVFWPWNDDKSCLASYSEKIHRNLPIGNGQYPDSPLNGVRAISFGSGFAVAAVQAVSFEKGGVYSSNGTYACYLSNCYMRETNAEISAFSAIGQYEFYDDKDHGGFVDPGYQVYLNLGYFVGAGYARVWDYEPGDVTAATVGEVFSVSLGLDVLPVTAGVAYCTVEVNEVIRDWKEISAPDAKCSDRNVCADGPAACTVAASIDDGSTVPDGVPVLEQTPAGPYGIGETQVALRVSDANGASDTCSALVDVRDCTPPAISCRETVAECQHDRTAFVEPLPPTVEDCTAYSVNGPAARDYPLGSTPVQFVVEDAYDNESSCATQVRVVDTRPPQVLSASAQPAVLWPPNHKMQTVQIRIEARDACDPNAACALTGIDSNESDRRWWDWNDRSGDARIVGPRTVALRAERSGWGGGRVYTVRFECTDTTEGNVAHGSVQIKVPHDLRK